MPPHWLVLLAGASAALHLGKLPPALPLLEQGLGLTLVTSGFLLSLVQLAGVLLGLAVGLLATRLGLRRTMLAGLVILAVAGGAGAFATSPGLLLATRAGEGLGFLLASMPAPALVRRLVPPAKMSAALGLWGAYMPAGMGLALLAGPAVMAAVGWQGWWALLAALSACMALWLVMGVPADGAAGEAGSGRFALGAVLRETLRAPGPWLAALTFCAYSGQWLAVVGFLPSLYAQAGWSAAAAALATAAAAAVNAVGNIASGRLLQRGLGAPALLRAGFVGMAAGAALAYSPLADLAGAAGGTLRYLGVLAFSSIGGLVPGTLFSLAVRLTPGDRGIPVTVGWMQQWSALGQFAGPPLVALVAAAAGGWHLSWLLTGACSLAGLVLAQGIAGQLRPIRPGQGRAGSRP